MTKKILILGGYGNFGKRIAIALAKKNIPLILAGRDANKAEAVALEIKQHYPNSQIETAIFDIHSAFSNRLTELQPSIVIHTAGPFQNSNYTIAETCIEHKIHYIDLADGRDYVTGITALNEAALAHDALIVSGASTVPGLSSAVLQHYKNHFSEIDSLIYGITPGQKTPRGVATTKAVLSYLGKPLKSAASDTKQRYGWQDLYRQDYPELGKRWMANCDVPDIDIFPAKYGIRHTQFSAGMETSILHLGIWLVSYLVRAGLPLSLTQHAAALLRFSNIFDCLGTKSGGMHMLIKGKDLQKKPLEIKWFIIAHQGDGLEIPCVPAIILATKLFHNTLQTRGAMPCIEMITLEEFTHELQAFSIKQFVEHRN
jgi:hypothetical protein